MVKFTISYWGGDINDGKFTYGYVFQLCSIPLVWSCMKHKVVSLLTIKAEYRGTINVGRKEACISQFREDIRFPIKVSNIIHYDS